MWSVCFGSYILSSSDYGTIFTYLQVTAVCSVYCYFPEVSWYFVLTDNNGHTCSFLNTCCLAQQWAAWLQTGLSPLPNWDGIFKAMCVCHWRDQATGLVSTSLPPLSALISETLPSGSMQVSKVMYGCFFNFCHFHVPRVDFY